MTKQMFHLFYITGRLVESTGWYRNQESLVFAVVWDGSSQRDYFGNQLHVREGTLSILKCNVDENEDTITFSRRAIAEFKTEEETGIIIMSYRAVAGNFDKRQNKGWVTLGP